MKLASVLALVSLAGCSSAAAPVKVSQLLAQCDSYKGKPIRAAGYLGECSGYDCHLYADKAGLDAAAAAWADMRTAMRLASRGDKSQNARAGEALNRVDAIPSIGIAGSETFDRKAGPLRHHYVVITGRVDDHSCDGRGGTDRSAGIHPTDIRAWIPSEGAPANTQ